MGNQSFFGASKLNPLNSSIQFKKKSKTRMATESQCSNFSVIDPKSNERKLSKNKFDNEVSDIKSYYRHIRKTNMPVRYSMLNSVTMVDEILSPDRQFREIPYIKQKPQEHFLFSNEFEVPKKTRLTIKS